jgi:hypothetical protein
MQLCRAICQSRCFLGFWGVTSSITSSHALTSGMQLREGLRFNNLFPRWTLEIRCLKALNQQKCISNDSDIWYYFVWTCIFLHGLAPGSHCACKTTEQFAWSAEDMFLMNRDHALLMKKLSWKYLVILWRLSSSVLSGFNKARIQMFQNWFWNSFAWMPLRAILTRK